MDTEEYELGKELVNLGFIDAVQSTKDFDDDLFGDPSQDISPKSHLGLAFHLPIDPNIFMREGKVYEFLDLTHLDT
jgi:hypothetical protein